MTSYQALINKIEAFYNDHLQVKKVGSDFNEQLPNFATKDEKYPLVFITPIVASTTMDVNTISLEVYCLDIIQKDRANITVILSDCHQILVDLINYFNFSNDYSFDIVGSPSITPLNNQLLDYAAGWVMTLDVDISNWTNCQVPLNLPVVVSCETISVTYTLEGEEPVTVEVENVADEYTIEDIGTIEKVGDEWVVISGDSCNDCVKVSFTYEGVIYEYNLQKTAIVNGKNEYTFNESLNPFSPIVLNWNESSSVWAIQINVFETGDVGVFYNETDNECPIFSSWLIDTSAGIENIITSSCQSTQATFSENTECPFGDYTLEDGSIFSAFEVNPIL
jgi:hypothetical protein